MTLAERFAAGPPVVVRGKPCSVAVLLDSLPEAEAEPFRGALVTDSGWAHSAIYEAIVAEGRSVGRQSVGVHRRGQCGCAT